MTERESGPIVVRVAAAGDAALVLEFPRRVDPLINDRVAGLASALRERWGAILRDVVPGYCSVTVYFDPLHVDAGWLEEEMRAAADDVGGPPPRAGALIEVPVCYEGEFGPDLPEVAAFAGCSPDEVAALHTSVAYRVYVLGFVPGFAYLAEVPDRIAAPRRATPRPLVAAGSVGIAGRQTGIYPYATPGGWNIIGRTWIKPYRPAREPAARLQVGDTGRVVRISREELERHLHEELP